MTTRPDPIVWLPPGQGPGGGNPTNPDPAGDQCCMNDECSSSRRGSPCDKWEGWYGEITVAGTREFCNSEYIYEWVNIHLNSPVGWPEHEEFGGTHVAQYFNIYGKEGELITDEASQDAKIVRRIKGDTIQIFFHGIDLGSFDLKYSPGADPCEGSSQQTEYLYTWVCDGASS